MVFVRVRVGCVHRSAAYYSKVGYPMTSIIRALRLRGAGPTGDEGFNFRQRWRAWHVLGECNEVRLLGKGQLRVR
jgi:hypothetical protein